VMGAHAAHHTRGYRRAYPTASRPFGTALWA
jgi:hypothetical protein